MSLTSKIFRIFTFIFLAQLAVVGYWAASLLSSEQDKYPVSLIDSLTKVDGSILEGVVLQNKMGSVLARDLIAYRLLELNNVDSAEYVSPMPVGNVIETMALKECSLVNEITVCNRSNGKIVVSLIPLKFGSALQGYLKLEKSLKFVDEVNKKILFTIGVTVLAVFIINIITLVMIWWKFLKPETDRLINVLATEREDPELQINEFRLIQSGFLESLLRVKKAESDKSELLAKLEKTSLATQVAHDIRSPLEVLKSLKGDISSLPHDSRRRLELSISRIEEIAYNLLSKNRENLKYSEEAKPEELLTLVRSVLTEKRIEFKKLSSVELIEDSSLEAYGMFSKIDKIVLKNIISNLINNAVEASSLAIKISIYSDGVDNIISVADDGEGMSSEVQKDLFQKGFTTKTDGNGLGLYSAQKELLSVGGNLTFISTYEKGTSFFVHLPKCKAPETFIPEIKLDTYDKVVILDDDRTFHEIWSKVFQGYAIELENFYSISDFMSKYEEISDRVLLLTDFELMDENEDGISIIVKLNHTKHSVLVTARNEEESIRARCLQYEVKLLPKSLVNAIPVTNNSLTPKIVVLIDDDKLVRLNWSMSCKKKAIPFLSFSSVDEFLAESSEINKTSSIYIDSSLGNSKRGELESEKIYLLGFENLYIVTGYEKESFDRPHWIKSIFGKSPEGIV